MTPKRAAKQYDPKVLKLADYFLNEDDVLRTLGFEGRERRREALAQHIQDAVEAWFRANPLQAPAGEEE